MRFAAAACCVRTNRMALGGAFRDGDRLLPPPDGATGGPRPLRAHRRTKNVLRFISVVLPCGFPQRLLATEAPVVGLTRGVCSRVYPVRERSTGPSHRRPGFRLSPVSGSDRYTLFSEEVRTATRRRILYAASTAPVTLLRGPVPSSPRRVIGAPHPREARACQYDVAGSRSRRRATNGCRTSTAQGVTRQRNTLH